MATSAEKRVWYAAYECDPSKMVRHPFPGVSSNWELLVADVTVPAWQVFTDLMTKHGYLFREVAGGTYNCRNIAGTNLKSLHSYGIAVDLNPSKNPFGTTTTDMPKAFTDAVLDTGLFRWGMDFTDPMHWEIDVSPETLEDITMTPEEVGAIVEEKLKKWFGNPIAIPNDPTRITNQGVVNGVWHPVIYGQKAMDLLHEAAKNPVQVTVSTDDD